MHLNTLEILPVLAWPLRDIAWSSTRLNTASSWRLFGTATLTGEIVLIVALNNAPLWCLH
jgi:hypothetical protein